MKNKCIFLDRDGTINVYKNLLHKKEDFILLDNAAEAIQMINESDYLSIVVTNQPVVARNLCSFDYMWGINRKMEELLAKQGAYLDDIFVCPHHPDQGYPEENKEYKKKCNCRKPGIGLIEKAVMKHHIDLTKSYIIGDTTVDIKTGINAGLRTVLVKTGLKGEDGKFNVMPDFVSDDLKAAVEFVLTKASK